MSLTANPKPAAERPPTPPPVRTAFDGSGNGDDSWIDRLTEEVRRICRFADAASGEDLSQMIDLLGARRSMVIRETMLHISLGDLSLPPVSNLSVDFLLNFTPEERTLQGLLNQLDDCTARCERRLSRHRFEMRLLRDLGTSDT